MEDLLNTLLKHTDSLQVYDYITKKIRDMTSSTPPLESGYEYTIIHVKSEHRGFEILKRRERVITPFRHKNGKREDLDSATEEVSDYIINESKIDWYNLEDIDCAVYHGAYQKSLNAHWFEYRNNVTCTKTINDKVEEREYEIYYQIKVYKLKL